MKALLLNETGDTVLNVLAWDENCTIPEGFNIQLVPFDTYVSPGWTLANGVFTDPNPPPPPQPEQIKPVSSAQGMLALLDAGLLDTVTAFVDNSTDKALKIWFYRANTWERDNPYIKAVATQLGLTDQQIDDLFKSAATK